eukprot:467908-Rhodomonas_salina.1
MNGTGLSKQNSAGSARSQPSLVPHIFNAICLRLTFVVPLAGVFGWEKENRSKRARDGCKKPRRKTQRGRQRR